MEINHCLNRCWKNHRRYYSEMNCCLMMRSFLHRLQHQWHQLSEKSLIRHAWQIDRGRLFFYKTQLIFDDLYFNALEHDDVTTWKSRVSQVIIWKLCTENLTSCLMPLGMKPFHNMTSHLQGIWFSKTVFWQTYRQISILWISQNQVLFLSLKVATLETEKGESF